MGFLSAPQMAYFAGVNKFKQEQKAAAATAKEAENKKKYEFFKSVAEDENARPETRQHAFTEMGKLAGVDYTKPDQVVKTAVDMETERAGREVASPAQPVPTFEPISPMEVEAASQSSVQPENVARAAVASPDVAPVVEGMQPQLQAAPSPAQAPPELGGMPAAPPTVDDLVAQQQAEQMQGEMAIQQAQETFLEMNPQLDPDPNKRIEGEIRARTEPVRAEFQDRAQRGFPAELGGGPLPQIDQGQRPFDPSNMFYSPQELADQEAMQSARKQYVEGLAKAGLKEEEILSKIESFPQIEQAIAQAGVELDPRARDQVFKTITGLDVAASMKDQVKLVDQRMGGEEAQSFLSAQGDAINVIGVDEFDPAEQYKVTQFEDGTAVVVPAELEKFVQVDVGGEKQLVDPFTGEARKEIKKTLTPDQAADNRRAAEAARKKAATAGAASYDLDDPEQAAEYQRNLALMQHLGVDKIATNPELRKQMARTFTTAAQEGRPLPTAAELEGIKGVGSLQTRLNGAADEFAISKGFDSYEAMKSQVGVQDVQSFGKKASAWLGGVKASLDLDLRGANVNRLSQQLAVNFARAMGERGNLSETERMVSMQAMLTAGMSPEQAVTLHTYLMKGLQDYKDSLVSNTIPGDLLGGVGGPKEEPAVPTGTLGSVEERRAAARRALGIE